MLYFPRSVYRSLAQVLKVLSAPDVIKFPEVQQVLKHASFQSIVERISDESFVVPANNTNEIDVKNLTRDAEKPFIVIEGLDGSGKTTLTRFLQEKFAMELVVTPPKEFSELRSFFDSKPEGIRRAFYSLGNYMAAQYVRSTNSIIIMDRFWHSTAAYAFANHIKSGGEASSFSDDDLKWPSDLFKPNLVIFLDLSEQARLSRHSNRKEFTNTPEEQALAADAEFRKNIKESFRRIAGVPFVELNVDGSPKDCQKAITDCVLERFPAAFKDQMLKLNKSNQ